MRQWDKINDYLQKKKKIIEKIARNTETQGRFIHKREMRGLRRVLREREAFIQELATIDFLLSQEPSWKQSQELMAIAQEMNLRQQEILECSRQVIQQAVTERARIAMELKCSRVRQQVKTQYINPWAVVVQGRHFNEKG